MFWDKGRRNIEFIENCSLIIDRLMIENFI